VKLRPAMRSYWFIHIGSGLGLLSFLSILHVNVQHHCCDSLAYKPFLLIVGMTDDDEGLIIEGYGH
jgi:hypothetical protein